jgi:tRNA pseudouridine13 synthase
MTANWPRAWGPPAGTALIRCCPEDFRVSEQLGFELSGNGEHAFLYLQKRQLNSLDLLQRLSRFTGVAPRDIGLSGLKDRNAVTRQWFSIGMAGRPEPDWQVLAAEGDVQVLETGRHLRKLRRGVHRTNRFALVLRQLHGERASLESRLQQLRDQGVPNYFGEQRFGRNGSTLEQARRWMGSGRKISHAKRGLYFSALRAYLFNQLLAARVEAGTWNTVTPGDVCLLNGSRSFFTCSEVDQDTLSRVRSGDIHAGLPLWGRGKSDGGTERNAQHADQLADCQDICDFLVHSGLDMAWRPARLLPDDFCWQFCDDGSLQVDFALGAGGYATALLAEFVQYKEGNLESGIGSEQR